MIVLSVLDLMPGWSFFTFAILVPVVGWLVFGMYASFPDERSRQDWLWSGVLVGALLIVLYMANA